MIRDTVQSILQKVLNTFENLFELNRLATLFNPDFGCFQNILGTL